MTFWLILGAACAVIIILLFAGTVLGLIDWSD